MKPKMEQRKRKEITLLCFLSASCVHRSAAAAGRLALMCAASDVCGCISHCRGYIMNEI